MVHGMAAWRGQEINCVCLGPRCRNANDDEQLSNFAPVTTL